MQVNAALELQDKAQSAAFQADARTKRCFEAMNGAKNHLAGAPLKLKELEEDCARRIAENSNRWRMRTMCRLI